VWETVELRGVPLAEFMEQLRPHVANHWKNPPGFLTNFARKIGAVAMPGPPAAPAPTPEPPKNANGRCSVCKGIGYTDLAAKAYCTCRLGRDLKRTEERRAAREAPTEQKQGEVGGFNKKQKLDGATLAQTAEAPKPMQVEPRPIAHAGGVYQGACA
jgi:hypothetical protein